MKGGRRYRGDGKTKNKTQKSGVRTQNKSMSNGSASVRGELVEP